MAYRNGGGGGGSRVLWRETGRQGEGCPLVACAVLSTRAVATISSRVTVCEGPVMRTGVQQLLCLYGNDHYPSMLAVRTKRGGEEAKTWAGGTLEYASLVILSRTFLDLQV